MADSKVPEPEVARIYEIVIALLPVRIKVDRRVLVPDGASLADLHLIIQAAMGWENYHLHSFKARDGTIYAEDDEEEEGLGDVEEASVCLADVLHEPGDTLTYVYDYGDYWEHRVRLRAIRDAPEVGAPACIGGRGACPPEDCGGVGGYLDLCDALADPGSEGYEVWAEWFEDSLTPPFDPSSFDLAAADQAVRSLTLQGRCHR